MMADSILISSLALGVSSAAFALQIRRWMDEGVRLSLNVIANAGFVGGAKQKKDESFIALTVTNRGTAATTITHMLLIEYASWFGQVRGRPSWQGWVSEPAAMSGYAIPYVLKPGEIWQGMARHNPEVRSRVAHKRFFVAIAASNRRKYYRIRARIEERDLGAPAA